jgi:hypothetical protein
MKKAMMISGLAAVSLLIAAVLAIFFRDWFRDQVVIPLVYAGWIIYLLILSLPQMVYWSMLLFFGILVFLTTALPKPAPGRVEKNLVINRSFSRYSSWLRYTQMVNRSVFASDNLARDLVRLAVQILSSQMNLTAEEIYRKLDHGEIDLPPDLMVFLRRRGFATPVEKETLLQEIIHRFIPAREGVRPPGVYTPMEQETKQIVTLIEGLLTQNNPDLEENVEVR